MINGIIRLTRITYADEEVIYEPVYINSKFISSFRKHKNSEGTVVWVSGDGRYEVKETPEDILKLITFEGKCLNDTFPVPDEVLVEKIEMPKMIF